VCAQYIKFDEDYGEKSVLIQVPYYLGFTNEPGKFGTYLYDVTVDGWVHSKSKLEKEEWVYIAVTYDSKTKEINLYLNGDVGMVNSGGSKQITWTWGDKGTGLSSAYI